MQKGKIYKTYYKLQRTSFLRNSRGKEIIKKLNEIPYELLSSKTSSRHIIKIKCCSCLCSLSSLITYIWGLCA